VRDGDVVVLGGGVVGLALAFELAGRGVGVVVVEPGGLGESAFDAGLEAGSIGPQADLEPAPEAAADLSLLSRHLYADWIDRIEAESGLACELDARGAFTVALSEVEEVQLDRALDWQRARGLPFEVLSAEEARLREPALGPDAVSAFAFPLEAQVSPSRLVRALAVAARAAGVRLVDRLAVLGLVTEGGRAVGVETTGGRFGAGTVVLAASGRLPLLSGAPPLPLASLTAPVVRLDAGDDPDRPTRALAALSLRLAPRRDGSLLAIGPWERTGRASAPSAGTVTSLLARAARLTPSAEDFPVLGVGTGLRRETPDGVPLLGETGLPGFLCAEGGDEIGTAPGRAAFLADLVTGRTPPLPPAGFSPSRSGL